MRDQSVALLLVGLVLLLPPVAGIFHLNDKIWGVPFTLIYLFLVWACLIIGAKRVATGLSRAQNSEFAAGSTEPD